MKSILIPKFTLLVLFALVSCDTGTSKRLMVPDPGVDSVGSGEDGAKGPLSDADGYSLDPLGDEIRGTHGPDLWSSNSTEADVTGEIQEDSISGVGEDEGGQGGSSWTPDDYAPPLCKDGMCFVPAGEFWVGCNTSVDSPCIDQPWNTPFHKVYLPEYWMDRAEVTQTDFQECIDQGICSERSYTCPTFTPQETPNHPATCVFWDDADSYCRWLGKRLPTELEWEKGARGTDGRIYPWGNEPPDCTRAMMHSLEFGDAWGCGTMMSDEVCSREPGFSPYGLCDMSGNAWEWVSDWDTENYEINGPQFQSTDPELNIPETYRIIRGGGWGSSLFEYLSTSSRDAMEKTWSGDPLGFRCVKDSL